MDYLSYTNKPILTYQATRYDFDSDRLHIDPLREPQFLHFCPDITTYQVYHSGQISEHHSIMVSSS